MKEIIRTKQVEIKKYVAEDGKEFDTVVACLEYEKENKKILRYTKRLEEIEKQGRYRGVTPLDGGEYMGYREYRWYKPQNMDDINMMNKLFTNGWNQMNENDVGKWLCVEGDDFDTFTGDFYVMSLEDSVKNIKFFLNLFEITL